MNDLNATDLINKRFSPLAFSNKNVEEEKIIKFFEAARWAPSAFNEQPWRFIYAHKIDTERFEKIRTTMVEGNNEWAQKAAVLMLVMAKKTFTHNANPNPYHQFDTGMAMENFIISALESGVYVHQMAGFDHELARRNFEVSDDYTIISIAAIGFPGETASLPENLQIRAARPRTRKKISELLLG